ncbi:zinc-binding dehydrogenase [Streptomyces sp. NPDC007088]|uniref:zinc-binding dehydrogenase n=1 Tax=Streptomyces sp. NPDC007088 TaxID=3364773 RepID=UPI0036792650
MHAIRHYTFGAPDVLVYERVDDPVPGPGQVLVAVAAAGVHLLDTAIRSGVTTGPMPTPPELPTVPGREIAGTVVGLGAGADPGLLGKRVVAHLGFAPGGYAELAAAETARLHEIPGTLDEAAAVAMIGTGRTALGVLNFAALGPGDVALVLAAAGGIGTLLTQYARNAGATVVGLAGGARKTALVTGNGADLSLDYNEPGWPSAVRRSLGGQRPVTVVFDGVGGAAAEEAVRLLAPGGRHLVFGWSSRGISADGSGFVLTRSELAERGITSQSVLGPAMTAREGGENPMRALESRALAEAAAGRLRPGTDRFPLAAAAQAHRALEGRATVGKVVLEP